MVTSTDEEKVFDKNLTPFFHDKNTQQNRSNMKLLQTHKGDLQKTHS